MAVMDRRHWQVSAKHLRVRATSRGGSGPARATTQACSVDNNEARNKRLGQHMLSEGQTAKACPAVLNSFPPSRARRVKPHSPPSNHSTLATALVVLTTRRLRCFPLSLPLLLFSSVCRQIWDSAESRNIFLFLCVSHEPLLCGLGHLQ
jgi:hypothetical protein